MNTWISVDFSCGVTAPAHFSCFSIFKKKAIAGQGRITLSEIASHRFAAAVRLVEYPSLPGWTQTIAIGTAPCEHAQDSNLAVTLMTTAGGGGGQRPPSSVAAAHSVAKRVACGSPRSRRLARTSPGRGLSIDSLVLLPRPSKGLGVHLGVLEHSP